MAGMYRVHCFKTFGGQDWMKILLALGHVDAKVTEIANDITTRRIREKAGRDASTLTQADPILSKRTRQIMEGLAATQIDPPRASPGAPNAAKQAREHAKTFSKLKERSLYRKWDDALPELYLRN